MRRNLCTGKGLLKPVCWHQASLWTAVSQIVRSDYSGKDQLCKSSSSVEEDDGEDSLGELTSSGDILGEDNMFTGGEDLQNKGKARTMRMVQAKQRVSCQRPGNDAVLADFVSQLRSYRSLKRELSSWTSAFLAEQGRAPRLADVELTRESFKASMTQMATLQKAASDHQPCSSCR